MRIRWIEAPRRWAVTAGLAALGQAELALTLDWPVGDPLDAQTVRFLEFIGGYVASQPKRISAGQTLAYGWVQFRFRPATPTDSGVPPAALVVQERPDPLRGAGDFADGVRRGLALIELQDQVMRRYAITGEAVHPRPNQMAIICARIPPEASAWPRAFQAHRRMLDDPGDSGWFVGCMDNNHHHNDPEQLHVVHLDHLVQHFPPLLPYLALPDDTQLLFDPDAGGRGGMVVFRPGEANGFLDAAPLWYTFAADAPESQP